MWTKKLQRVSLGFIHLPLMLCFRCQLLLQSYLEPVHTVQFLTLLSVNSDRQWECFLLQQLRGLFHSSRVSVTQVNIFCNVAELFLLRDVSKEMHFDFRKLQDALIFLSFTSFFLSPFFYLL